MPEQSSATPRGDQLDRIEAKLDELLDLKDAALSAFPKFGKMLMLAKLRKQTR